MAHTAVSPGRTDADHPLSTAFEYDDTAKAYRARAYEEWCPWGAAGRVFSTAEDMLNFAMAHAGATAVDGKPLPAKLSDGFREALKPRTPMPKIKGAMQAFAWVAQPEDPATPRSRIRARPSAWWRDVVRALWHPSMRDGSDEMLPAAPSASSIASRPLIPPAAALAVLFAALVCTILSVEVGARHLFGAYVPPSLQVAVLVVAYELATGSVVLCAALVRLARDRAARRARPSLTMPSTPAVSVLIAAYNEASDFEDRGIVATVRDLTAQRGVSFEILVGDDGSQDGTYDSVVHAFDLRPADGGHCGELVRADGASMAVRIFRFAHAGKGATLNALAARASHEVLVTLDADTSPDPSALSSLASAFDDPRVDMAGGVISVRGAPSVLTSHQRAEYRKDAVSRLGWSALGALEQVPGAFAGIRAASFREAGGFPIDSLTEDYEIAYRLVRRFAASRRVPVVVTVPSARAFTDVPTTVGGLVRQRTRWFAGFLSTLFRFRDLIGQGGAGAFGLVRFPLKVFEAFIPVLGFASLVAIVHGASSPILAVTRIALGIAALKWGWDLTFYAVALRLDRHLGMSHGAVGLAKGPGWQEWLCAATEAFTYLWLRYVAALRAFGWAVRRVKTWEPSRGAAVAGSDSAQASTRPSDAF